MSVHNPGMTIENHERLADSLSEIRSKLFLNARPALYFIGIHKCFPLSDEKSQND